MSMFSNLAHLFKSFHDGQPGNDFTAMFHTPTADPSAGTQSPVQMPQNAMAMDPNAMVAASQGANPPPIPQPPHGGTISKLLSFFGG